MVLQKRVTPPVKPMSLEFLTVHWEAPGDADESRTDISFKSAHEGAVLEGPEHKPQNVKYPTMDPGAIGDADKSRSDSSF